MEKLNFFSADAEYVQFLQKAEYEKRNFSRVPNVVYSNEMKSKFFCGIVLKVNNIDYRRGEIASLYEFLLGFVLLYNWCLIVEGLLWTV